MATESRSGNFNLKIAKGLLDEVSAQTEDVIQLQKLAHEEERFRESLKANWKAEAELTKLKSDLDRAIALASAVFASEPSCVLEDGTTCKAVIAAAHNQNGLIEFRLGNWEKAIGFFQQAIGVMETQESIFNAALCKLNMIRTFDPLAPLKNPFKGIEKRMKMFTPWKKDALNEVREGFGLTGTFVSGKYSKEEILDTLNRVIDLDPETDTALEAGKIIIRMTTS